MGGFSLRSLIGVLLLLASCQCDAALSVDWSGQFSQQERDRLERWIVVTSQALERLVGPLPMGLRVTFHRLDGRGEPVPWANTRRGAVQGVDFYVDPSFGLEDFLADWTAPHELSHLILPYLGRRNAWFAEGFASYLQYQVMMEIGVLEARSANQRFAERVDRARREYPFVTLSLVEAAPKLVRLGAYPVLYWGGSVYFLRVDRRLREEQASDLLQTLRAYLACCRRPRDGIDGLLAELDAASGSRVFSQEYERFLAETGFPVYDEPRFAAD